MDNKRQNIISGAEDIIAEAIQKYKNGEKIDPEQIGLIYEGIRILHHIQGIDRSLKAPYPTQIDRMGPKA